MDGSARDMTTRADLNAAILLAGFEDARLRSLFSSSRALSTCMESGTCWTIDGQIELNRTWHTQENALYPNRFHLPAHVEENAGQAEVLYEAPEDLVF